MNLIKLKNDDFKNKTTGENGANLSNLSHKMRAYNLKNNPL